MLKHIFGNRFGKDKKVERAMTTISNHALEKLQDIRVFGYLCSDGNESDYSDEYKVARIFKNSPYMQFSNNAEFQAYNAGKISENDLWKYYINPYGFRNEWDFTETDQKKIGCFGDSFTFGDGIAANEIHSYHLSELCNSRVYNVGKGGSSIQRIARTFSAFTKFVKIDIAVFTLPHVYREFIIDMDGLAADLIPGFPGQQGNYHTKMLEPFLQLPEYYQKTKLSLLVNYILDIAAERNIKVLFTTWDIPTHELLQTLAPLNIAENIFPNDLDQCQARDLQHPGKLSQKKHAENIVKELHDRAWI
jgi:hypothetical protein